VGYGPGGNKWDLVFDFTPKEGGKNFRIMELGNWKLNKVPIENMDEEPEVVFSYPEAYGGTIPDDVNVGKAADHGVGSLM